MSNGSTATSHDRAASVDEAAFGIIYGSITVMGVLAATNPDYTTSFNTAGTLFFSVLAVTLAKAYADVVSTVLKTGRSADRQIIMESWHHSRSTLLAANGPTLAMLLGAVGLYGPDLALLAAQVIAIGVLFFYGARIGLRLSGTWTSAILGAGLTGGIGLAISLVKTIWH